MPKAGSLHQRRIDAVTGPCIRAKRGSKWSEWQRPIMKNYLLGCCDCGLQHWFDFRVDKDGDVEFRVARATGYTRLARKASRYAKS